MEKFFNTAGPIKPDIHYSVNPLSRVNLSEINAIYKEVIPRELTWSKQETILNQSAWYINDDNSINMPKLLKEFQSFYSENAESWDKKLYCLTRDYNGRRYTVWGA